MKDPKNLLLRNVITNWSGMAIGLLIAFFMSPFLVHSLGTSEYGVWALVFSVVAYTNLLDVGMKQSLARYIPRYYATGDYDKLNEVLNSSNFVYIITGTLVILATLAAAFFFADAFKVEPQHLATMRLTLIIVGLDQAVTFFFMAGAAIGPFHRYDVNNVIGVLFQVASTLAMVYFVRAGHGLVAMALITIATTIARNVVRRIYQQRLVPQIKFGIRFINKGIIRELLSYGIISFFIVVSWMIVFNTSNIIIGLFLTTTAVTYYNIAGTIVNNLRILIGAVGIPLVPAVSHYDAKGDKSMIASLYGKLTRYLFYFSGCVATGVLIFGDNFIYQWMGPDFAATVRILYILIIPLAVYLPQNMATSILLGIGKHRVLFYVLMAEAIVNLALSLALVKPLGLVGIALGMAITQIAIYTYVFPSIFFKIIGGSLGAFYRYSLKSLVTGTLFLGPVGLILDRFVPVPGWIGIIIYGLAMGILGLWGFWWKVCDPDDRQRLLSRLPLRVRPAPQKP